MKKKMTIADVVESIKRHLKLDHVRLALAVDCTTGTCTLDNTELYV